MKITYIYHSCFVLESNNFTIIFDFYQDSDSKFIQKHLSTFKGKIYVFATHAHADHFNAEIFLWKNIRKDIQYILSEDILEDGLCKNTDGIILNKGEEYSDDILNIKVFGSTDKGVSFFINTPENKKIFYAGDLNNWHWNEESTPEEIKEAEDFYTKELTEIIDYEKHIDICMFPVDPRLGADYAKGAIQLLEQADVSLFIPMHFWEDYTKAGEFAEKALQRCSQYWKIGHQEDCINIL